jgi:hypothetical protein
MDPRAGVDAVEKREILHSQESNPGPAARNPSLYRLSSPDSLAYEYFRDDTENSGVLLNELDVLGF